MSSSPHPGVERLLPYLRQVTQAGSQVNVTSRFPLSDLVTGDLTELFRYSGGLTTPSCDEIVEVRLSDLITSLPLTHMFKLMVLCWIMSYWLNKTFTLQCNMYHCIM